MTTLEWTTATDWDNAQSESGVVHEDIGDHASGDVELGYPSFDRNGSALQNYHSMDDSSGPVTDHAGSYDLPVNGGPTFDVNSVFNATGIRLDGTDDFLGDTSSPSNGGTVLLPKGLTDWTVFMVIYPDSIPTDTPVHGGSGAASLASQSSESLGNDNFVLMLGNDSELYGYAQEDDGTNHELYSASGTIATNDFQAVAATYSAGGQFQIWADESGSMSSVGSASLGSNGMEGSGNPYTIGADPNGDNPHDGVVDEHRVYTRELSQAQLQALYDAWTAGSLTTGKKTS